MATARYTVPMGDAKVYGQLNGMYQTSASSDLRVDYAAALGRLLDKAEQKVTVMQETAQGELTEQPFDAEEAAK